MIDLDGVLDNYRGYSEEIPEIREGAREAIKFDGDYNKKLNEIGDFKVYRK